MARASLALCADLFDLRCGGKESKEKIWEWDWDDSDLCERVALAIGPVEGGEGGRSCVDFARRRDGIVGGVGEYRTERGEG